MPVTRPNRHSLALLAIILTIWYAGAAQQNGTAYVLAFLLGSLWVVSYLHARQHLRGLTVTVGSLKSVSEGGVLRLPLTLAAPAGRLATGLEITSPSATAAVFVEQISAERPTPVSLAIRQSAAGREDKVAIIVRSRYPLGFFTTEHRLTLATPHCVHPRPAGDQPLPAATPIPQGATQPAGPANPHAGGDDFNGLRSWSPGDPLRHVDWKAVARGRPMMVKQFTGAEASSVALRWDSLDLQPAARASQIAAWMAAATARGLSFSLQLPSVEIPAGSGSNHQRQCLDALATQLVSESSALTASTRGRQKRAPSLEDTDTAGGNQLAPLAGALAFLTLPMIGGDVPWISLAIFFSALALRWWRGSKRPLGLGWRLVLVGIGIAGVRAQTGSWGGVEAGVAYLLILAAGKLLESRTSRDLQVLALIGWFLCLCLLIFDQQLSRALYAAAAVCGIALALVRVRRGTSGLWAPLRTTALMLAQALPLVMVLFLFFPRGTAGLVTSLSRSLQHQTGISDTLDPGSVAKVAESEAPAFRASIVSGSAPPAELYWRCLTLTQCDGLSWSRGTPIASAREEASAEGAVRQIISVEPHGALWLPALDRPIKIVKGGSHQYLETTERTLRSLEPVRFGRRYEIISSASSGQRTLPQSLRAACLEAPLDLSPAVRALVQRFRAEGAQDKQIVTNALRFYSTGGFSYNLQPGAYGGAALDEFLFSRKVGFCEHFAASFGTLMRAAGVPTRLVVGYLGGESFGSYYLVRQYNAHVWAEVFLEGSGWTRVDPTATLAPARLNTNFRNLMTESFTLGFSLPRDAWWGRAALAVQIFWDNLNYQWFTRVVQFGEDEQFSLLAGWGLASLRKMALAAGISVACVLLGLWFWIKRAISHPDPAVRLWQHACIRLERKGLPRKPHEAPLTFAARHPQLPALSQLAELYAAHRYGRSPVALKELREAADKLHKSLSRSRS